MAVSAVYTKEIVGQKRTTHIEIDTPHGGNRRVDVWREVINLDTGDRVALPIISRSMADCPPSQSVTLASGKVLTALEIEEAVARLIDTWDP